MSKIDELLKGEKVEWKNLGDSYVCESITTGLNPRKNFRINDSSDGELTSWYITTKDYSINEKIEFVEGKTGRITEEARKLINKRSKLQINDILFSAVGTVGKIAIVEIEPNNFDVNESTFVLKPNKKNILPMFLLHYLRSDYIQKEVKKFLKGSTLAGIRKGNLEKLKIPVLSIETQEKIVKTLDKFTECVTELQAELQARVKQYEYYRDELLSEDYLKKLTNRVCNFDSKSYELKSFELNELVKIRNGKDWKNLEKGNIPVYGSGGNMDIYVNKYSYDKPTVLIPRKGSIENVFYLEEPFWNVDTIFYTEIDENKIIPKYFYYFIENFDISKLCTSSTRPSLTQSVLNKVKIDLPPLEIQSKVVEILDKFQSLVSETQGLLPQEIEQRQKQYEFYREKLLTFNENMIQVKSSQVLIASGYFTVLKEACDILGINLIEIKWEKLGTLLDYEQPSKYIVKSTEYDENYSTPVLTPGKTFILGYTNETEGIYNSDKENPVIIFDDFTSATKWIDFNFKVKSSAIKILKPREGINFRYSYYYMSTLKVDTSEHKRLWISKFSEIKIPIPPLYVQEYVVSILDKFDSLINNINEGLPKEIELRQKQYEYYREKLLDFPR